MDRCAPGPGTPSLPAAPVSAGAYQALGDPAVWPSSGSSRSGSSETAVTQATAENEAETQNGRPPSFKPVSVRNKARLHSPNASDGDQFRSIKKNNKSILSHQVAKLMSLSFFQFYFYPFLFFLALLLLYQGLAHHGPWIKFSPRSIFIHSFFAIQPCLIPYALFTATFIPWWQSVVGAENQLMMNKLKIRWRIYDKAKNIFHHRKFADLWTIVTGQSRPFPFLGLKF